MAASQADTNFLPTLRKDLYESLYAETPEERSLARDRLDKFRTAYIEDEAKEAQSIQDFRRECHSIYDIPPNRGPWNALRARQEEWRNIYKKTHAMTKDEELLFDYAHDENIDRSVIESHMHHRMSNIILTDTGSSKVKEFWDNIGENEKCKTGRPGIRTRWHNTFGGDMEATRRIASDHNANESSPNTAFSGAAGIHLPSDESLYSPVHTGQDGSLGIVQQIPSPSSDNNSSIWSPHRNTVIHTGPGRTIDNVYIQDGEVHWIAFFGTSSSGREF